MLSLCPLPHPTLSITSLLYSSLHSTLSITLLRSLLYLTFSIASLANSSSIYTYFTLYFLQINSIFIYLKYSRGQQTTNLPSFTYSLSSSKIISDVVFKSKNIVITIARSKPLDFYLICLYTFLLNLSYNKELSQSSRCGFRTVILYDLRSSIISFYHSIALPFSILLAKKTDFPAIAYIVRGL